MIEPSAFNVCSLMSFFISICILNKNNQLEAKIIVNSCNQCLLKVAALINILLTANLIDEHAF